MDDTISRQAAIEVVQNRHMMLSKEKVLLINDLKKLPSAQPKRGKWIEIEVFDDSRYVKCDQCKTVQVFYYGKRNTNFCPNCGCDMRGEQDE